MKNKRSTDEGLPAKSSLWGKQTELSLQYFNIGQHTFPRYFICALVQIKKAAAQVNYSQGGLPQDICTAIVAACDDILQPQFAEQYDEQFPLRIWQTGSGTQTNMNVNEVIASLANQHIQQQTHSQQTRIHANDHINMSQSSNDVFPSAMHITVAELNRDRLMPSLRRLQQALQHKQDEFSGELAVGRTHLMDALPVPISGVFSGYARQLSAAQTALEDSLQAVYLLAIGGTAVGTGANAPFNFGHLLAHSLAQQYQLPFIKHDNGFAAVSGEEGLLRYSAALKQLATSLFKLASDVKLLGSGPNCGFNEWHLPANEPGSSIMPGKVNPTQCEALSMVCLQVFGNDLTVSLSASQGQLQLNTYRPVIIHNVMESIDLLSDAMSSFAEHCILGLKLNQGQIDKNMQNNLSLITLLAPQLGYDVSASIVNEAHNKQVSLAEAAELLGLYSQQEFSTLLKKHLQAAFDQPLHASSSAKN